MMRPRFAVALTCALVCSSAAAQRALRDPFARPAPPPVAVAVAAPIIVEPPPPLHLRAVILNGAHSLANIDGDIVAAGEQARDYSVLRIDAHGVLVTRAGKQQLLTINEKDKQ